jgi:hypothetical protein
MAGTVIFSSHSFANRLTNSRSVCRLRFWRTLPIIFLVIAGGCNRLREPAKTEKVYVVAEQTYLRDRVAAVSNRVALVSNGEPLDVVEHGRRFLKVKTGKGEMGWIEDHLVIQQPVYDEFIALQKQHEHDPVVATGVLRDALYLHLKPGRETERFYLLPENDKLQLLIRASIPKQGPPGSYIPPPKPAVARAATATGKAPLSPPKGTKLAADQAQRGPMEDWWLVRDNQGAVGWLLARRLDVDVPDEIGGYSEGQKMVGAYILNKVDDPDSSFPGRKAPQYVAVLNAYKDGLPYDFDQIRVFTWNVRKHRYETAYRERNIEGYLPVDVTQEKVDGPNPVPVFSVRVATSEAVTSDPLTGVVHPSQTESLRFALLGNIVKRISPPGDQSAVIVHPHPVAGQHGARRHRAGSSGGR